MKKSVIYLCVLCLVVVACAQNNSKIILPESVGISSEKLKQLKDSLHHFVNTGKLAGIQTAILRKDQLIHFDSYGYADIDKKTPLNERSIFRIFSMTKPITSVGLMMLYEQGKFKLNDPVHMYIPELKHMTVLNEANDIVSAKNAITIMDLLRHSSGISYGRSHNQKLNNLYSKERLGNAYDLKDFIKKLSKLPLLFEPGTAYEYGHSTNVCGYLIQVLSGQSLNEYLKEKVLTPLKMLDTHFQLPKDKIPYLTTVYRAGKNNTLVVSELPEQSMFANNVTFYRAGGGLVSTTNDYLNFCRMLLNRGSLFNHQILKPETLDVMFKDHLVAVREHTPRLRILPGETGFGLGFSVSEKDGKKIYGWGGAVGTYYRIEPEQDLAYIMMVQISPYRQLKLRKTFQNLVNQTLIH